MGGHTCSPWLKVASSGSSKWWLAQRPSSTSTTGAVSGRWASMPCTSRARGSKQSRTGSNLGLHLTPHSTEGDRARAPQPDSGAGDLYLPNWPPEEAEDARDDAEDDDVGYMQTHATGSSSSSSRPVVPEGCLAAAMVRRALRRLAAVLATTSEVELQQRVENLMLQMDPHSLGGTTEPPSRGEALNNEYGEVIRQLAYDPLGRRHR